MGSTLHVDPQPCTPRHTCRHTITSEYPTHRCGPSRSVPGAASERPVRIPFASILPKLTSDPSFTTHYAPWLPAISLFSSLSTLSPFLATVIHVTALRTSSMPLPHSTVIALRERSRHYVGQIFANSTAYPVIESLYALLVLIMWPLEPADDITLLIHGAKNIVQSADEGRLGLAGTRTFSLEPNTIEHAELSAQDLHLIRMWYSLCASETIFTIGVGILASPPPTLLLRKSLGTPPRMAFAGRPVADILLVLQVNLHHIVIGAMGARSLDPNLDGHGSNEPTSSQSLPHMKEALEEYITTVSLFLSRLLEWEIEMNSIKIESPAASHIHFAILEIEYHFLTIVYIAHTILIFLYALPPVPYSSHIKSTLWRWNLTCTKGAHRILELWSTFIIFGPNAPHPHAHPHSRRQTAIEPLSLAPDRVYVMIVVALVLMVRQQVAVCETARKNTTADRPPLICTRQTLLSIGRVARDMGGFGPSHDKEHAQDQRREHAAVRYAEILGALLKIWEDKHAVLYALARQTSRDDQEHPSSRPSNGSSVRTEENDTPESISPQPDHSDVDLGGMLGFDIFSDMTALFPWDSSMSGSGSWDVSWGLGDVSMDALAGGMGSTATR
ncbi:hypothetical protein M422DRAFT_256245 [Sphaerobolus stellatus SS14]|uniref:Transcription factor domain-containing protein n=1 Tax=Sphaerobolus stellatus (strain SS14) TaxID=990650 RepID=A0A0C9VHB7_SPHS4|nr:hypothetical protein M422DRAFT_256245 [Sphaerobolus stellatus SS14]